MLPTTKQALTAILAADPSVTLEQRKAFFMTASAPVSQPSSLPRIIRREEAARLLGVGVKRIDQLCRSGVLKRITVLGTTRAIGIAEASIRAITEGSAA